MKRLSYKFYFFIFFIFCCCSKDNYQDVTFYRMGKNDFYYPQVALFFEKIIKPLYGDQTTALYKINQREDRFCDLLLDKKTGDILGILVFKSEPNKKEFVEEGKTNVLEIKTFFLTNFKKDERKGLGTLMLNQLIKFSKKKKNFDYLVVTVSEKIDSSRSFFEKKGFEIFRKEKDKYIKGSTEYYYSKKVF